MLKALLVAACAAWHGSVLGFYPGDVESVGRKPIDTWIEQTDAGLAGRYVLHEQDRDVAGTLEALGDEDCNVALFRWTDLYGTGIARLHFDPARHCFEGTWGPGGQPLPQLTWEACSKTPVTS